MLGRQESLGGALWPAIGDSEKTKLVTRTSGRVLLRLSVATRYFSELGICTGPPSAGSGTVYPAAQDAQLNVQIEECRKLFNAYMQTANGNEQGFSLS